MKTRHTWDDLTDDARQRVTDAEEAILLISEARHLLVRNGAGHSVVVRLDDATTAAYAEFGRHARAVLDALRVRTGGEG